MENLNTPGNNEEQKLHLSNEELDALFVDPAPKALDLEQAEIDALFVKDDNKPQSVEEALGEVVREVVESDGEEETVN